MHRIHYRWILWLPGFVRLWFCLIHVYLLCAFVLVISWVQDTLLLLGSATRTMSNRVIYCFPNQWSLGCYHVIKSTATVLSSSLKMIIAIVKSPVDIQRYVRSAEHWRNVLERCFRLRFSLLFFVFVFLGGEGRKGSILRGAFAIFTASSKNTISSKRGLSKTLFLKDNKLLNYVILHEGCWYHGNQMQSRIFSLSWWSPSILSAPA